MASLRRHSAPRSYRSSLARRAPMSDSLATRLSAPGSPASSGVAIGPVTPVTGRSSGLATAAEMMSRRARATRIRSTCTSAIRRARPISSGSWHPGAISSAMNATSALTSGSYITATLRPCLRAFCAERALPAAEVGPVPAGLPRRLARSLRLLMPVLMPSLRAPLRLPLALPAASGAVMRCPGRRPRTRRRWPPRRGATPARRLSGASGFRATRRRGAPRR